jgi:hypothetical protein
MTQITAESDINKIKGDVLAQTIRNYFSQKDIATDDPEFVPIYSNILKLAASQTLGYAAMVPLDESCTKYTSHDIVSAYAHRGISGGQANLVAGCACHLPSDQYDSEKDKFVDRGAGRRCEPLCMLDSAIKRYSDDNTEEVCNQTACVIGDVTIDLINSSAGDITLKELCGTNDKQQGSNCYIKSFKLLSENSKFGKINLSEACSSCYIDDPDHPGEVKTLPGCDISGPPGPAIPAPEEYSVSKMNKWFVAILIILFIVLFGIFLFFQFKGTPGGPSLTSSLEPSRGLSLF